MMPCNEIHRQAIQLLLYNMKDEKLLNIDSTRITEWFLEDLYFFSTLFWAQLQQELKGNSWSHFKHHVAFLSWKLVTVWDSIFSIKSIFFHKVLPHVNLSKVFSPEENKMYKSLNNEAYKYCIYGNLQAQIFGRFKIPHYIYGDDLLIRL